MSKPWRRATSTTNTYVRCKGVCGQVVPSHVTPQTCRYCNGTAGISVPVHKKKTEIVYKICSGLCASRVPDYVTPETCLKCENWYICPGVCNKPRRRRDMMLGCEACDAIVHPVGTCANGCVKVKLYDGFCRDCKRMTDYQTFVDTNGGIIPEYKVLVVVTTPRSGKSLGSYHANRGRPYLDIKIYSFPCLLSAYFDPKKLRLYYWSKTNPDDSVNYYCSGTDDVSSESQVYRYVVSNSIVGEIESCYSSNPDRAIRILNNTPRSKSHILKNVHDDDFEVLSSESEPETGSDLESTAVQDDTVRLIAKSYASNTYSDCETDSGICVGTLDLIISMISETLYCIC